MPPHRFHTDNFVTICYKVLHFRKASRFTIVYIRVHVDEPLINKGRMKMNLPLNNIYIRISDYFLARVHTKDYAVDQNCRQGSQLSPLELDGNAKHETVDSLLNGRLSSGDNLAF